MTVTFEVSSVKRANVALGHAKGEDVSRSPLVLLGSAVEATGANATPCLPIRQHGLLQTVRTAFEEHYPLVLTPDAIWLAIAQGFAVHVNTNADHLRGKFVRYEGRTKLTVRRDDFVKGSDKNAWPGVFQAFSDQIADFIGRQRDLVVCNFSTTGPCERAASEVVLMNAMQAYFGYRVVTRCGIPAITLEGTEEDWVSIRRRAQALEEYELGWWVTALGPVLDQFVAVSRGRVDVAFWCSIFKRDEQSGGPFVTGWVNVLFPYVVEDGVAPRRNPWIEAHRKGASDPERSPTEASIPTGISIVPFDWEYLRTTFRMELLAGFVGMAQDETTLALRPAIGWAVRDASRGAQLDAKPPAATVGLPDEDGRSGSSMVRLVAGRVVLADALLADDVRALADLLGALCASKYLACYVSGTFTAASRAQPLQPVPGKLVVGIEIAAAGVAEVSEPITMIEDVLGRLRRMRAMIWKRLSLAVGGRLSEVDELHLLCHSNAQSDPKGLGGLLVVGERIETDDGVDVHTTGSRWSRWAVRGTRVAEVHSMTHSHTTLEAPASTAPRGRAYYLIGRQET